MYVGAILLHLLRLPHLTIIMLFYSFTVVSGLIVCDVLMCVALTTTVHVSSVTLCFRIQFNHTVLSIMKASRLSLTITLCKPAT